MNYHYTPELIAAGGHKAGARRAATAPTPNRFRSTSEASRPSSRGAADAGDLSYAASETPTNADLTEVSSS